MLGSAAEADDAVQESWLRLSRAEDTCSVRRWSRGSHRHDLHRCRPARPGRGLCAGRSAGRGRGDPPRPWRSPPA